jgi:hypothetical protein
MTNLHENIPTSDSSDDETIEERRWREIENRRHKEMVINNNRFIRENLTSIVMQIFHQCNPEVRVHIVAISIFHEFAKNLLISLCEEKMSPPENAEK